MKLIPLSDVLKAMDSKELIDSITFVTGNRNKGTGGEIVTLKKVVQTGYYNRGGKAKSHRIPDQVRDDKGGAGIDVARNPEHIKNQTRNLMLSVSSQIRKCHIRLITQFNGMQVIW